MHVIGTSPRAGAPFYGKGTVPVSKSIWSGVATIDSGLWGDVSSPT